MRLRRLFTGILVSMLIVGVSPSAIAEDPIERIIEYRGASDFVGDSCEYVWADTDPDQPGIQPDVDAVGIPRPSTLPPTCKKDSNNEVITCHLARNIGPADPEQKYYPPCAGNLSAVSEPSLSGCTEHGTESTGLCTISTPAWFYGFCGQTYGGGSGGTYTDSTGKVWGFERLGFPRGRGFWEISQILTEVVGFDANGDPILGEESVVVRGYTLASIRHAHEAAGCDLNTGLSAIIFAGSAIWPAQERIIPPQPGWHWCDGTDGC